MTSDQITLARQHLDVLKSSPGWREQIAPSLTKRIDKLTADLLTDGEKCLDWDATQRARLERRLLIEMRDKPDTLITSLAENERQMLGRTKTAEN